MRKGKLHHGNHRLCKPVFYSNGSRLSCPCPPIYRNCISLSSRFPSFSTIPNQQPYNGMFEYSSGGNTALCVATQLDRDPPTHPYILTYFTFFFFFFFFLFFLLFLLLFFSLSLFLDHVDTDPTEEQCHSPTKHCPEGSHCPNQC